jgi:membrane protein implicated in regulation of membrane protease activity
MNDLELVFWHWFVFAAALGIIELIAPGVFFLWLALAAFITGAAVLLVPTIGTATQITVFGVLAMILVYVAWKFIRRNPIESDQPLLNQRSAQYVGKTFTLVDAIENGTGRVKIGDTTWKVEGPDAPVGTQVKVTGFDGPTLKVEAASK